MVLSRLISVSNGELTASNFPAAMIADVATASKKS